MGKRYGFINVSPTGQPLMGANLSIHRIRLGLGGKLILAILVAGSIPIVVGLSATYFRGNAQLIEVIGGRFRALAKVSAAKIDGELLHLITGDRELAELAADTQVPGIIAEARGNGGELLGHEVDRLVALQKVNPGVRDAEIEFFKEQLRHFEKALEHARLRLDAVRVIVAI